MNLVFSVVILTIFSASSGIAQAQGYPTKPVRIVVPFAAGGPVDFIARALGAKLSASFGQPVIVDNRAGASTIVGTENVVKSSPDGYSILIVGAGARTILPFVTRLPYDPAKDLIAVSPVASAPQIFVASTKAGYSSLGGFIAYAKSHPGKVNFGSVGNTTITYLVGAVLKKEAGIQVQDIPYGGGAPAVQALLGGEIDVLTADVSAVAPQIKAGKLIALAVTSATRSALLPDVPTVAEAGYPGALGSNIYGMFVAKNTSKEIVQKISQATAAAVKTPDLQDRFGNAGMLAISSSPDEFEKQLRADAGKWGSLAKSLGVRLE
ncbi:MAG: tripartite tricarboxylate transporter substrate binding protein [Betaproteobacteria bacterium]|nr:tripartite tricarboxylate transporter substrate binding protein [Betaproteobacteria bacterium]